MGGGYHILPYIYIYTIHRYICCLEGSVPWMFRNFRYCYQAGCVHVVGPRLLLISFMARRGTSSNPNFRLVQQQQVFCVVEVQETAATAVVVAVVVAVAVIIVVVAAAAAAVAVPVPAAVAVGVASAAAVNS